MYPVIDRSGVEENPGPLGGAPSRARAAPPSACEVLVCHAGACLARGAEAVLAEIELASVVGGGHRARLRLPRLLQRGAQRGRAQARRAGVGDGAHAAPQPRGGAEVVCGARRASSPRSRTSACARGSPSCAPRARQHAVAASHWNAALRGLSELAAKRPAAAAVRDSSTRCSPRPASRTASARRCPARSRTTRSGRSRACGRSRGTARSSGSSRATSSAARPHPRGRGRMPEPVTWHTTMLAEVGPNAEGPLPWVERDYTPISSAKDWEAGRCDILIKVYPDGACTSWLYRAAPARVWLSKPARTLRVPGLVADGGAFRPASVLLLLAGTGVVALPQILMHRDPMRQLAISTPSATSCASRSTSCSRAARTTCCCSPSSRGGAATATAARRAACATARCCSRRPRERARAAVPRRARRRRGRGRARASRARERARRALAAQPGDPRRGVRAHAAAVPRRRVGAGRLQLRRPGDAGARR